MAEFITQFKKAGGSGQLTFSTEEDLTEFTDRLKNCLAALRERITAIKETHIHVNNSLAKLRNFEVLENFNYWTQIIKESKSKLEGMVEKGNTKQEILLSDI